MKKLSEPGKAQTQPRFYEFREFRFDTEKRVLWRDGTMVALTPRASEVLLLLLENHGNLVERQEIVDRVWSETFVEDGNLNHAVSALRKVLGNELIQTVPRRGYRFTADVVEPPKVEPHLLVEKRTSSTSLIEEREIFIDDTAPLAEISGPARRRRIVILGAASLAVIAAMAAWLVLRPAAGNVAESTPSIKSLAVLPLRSFSRDDSSEKLRLRITDALITKLGRLDDLAVRPTNSVLRFASEDPDVVAAGRTLGVDAVLAGRVQEENGQLRVTLQLISVSSGNQIWAEQFDGRSGEILRLQDAIAGKFSRDLSLRNTREVSRRPALNNESYEAYLKGRYLWNQRRKDTYFKALEYFEQSVTIDPTFALGYTGIADCYYLLQQRNVLSTIDAYAKAEPAALKALELDPNLSEAHSSMGAINMLRYSRWSEAEQNYLKAIELDPNSAEAHGRLGMLYNLLRRFDEAYVVLKKAEEIDPTSLNVAIYLGANFYFSSQFDRAEKQFLRILEFAPGTERAHYFLTRIYEITDRPEAAVEHALKEREVSRPSSVEPLRAAFARGGIRGFWRKQVELLTEESREMFGLEYQIASRYALLNEFENATRYAEMSVEKLGAMTNLARVDPQFDRLRDYPAFADLMRRSARTGETFGES